MRIKKVRYRYDTFEILILPDTSLAHGYLNLAYEPDGKWSLDSVEIGWEDDYSEYYFMEPGKDGKLRSLPKLEEGAIYDAVLEYISSNPLWVNKIEEARIKPQKERKMKYKKSKQWNKEQHNENV